MIKRKKISELVFIFLCHRLWGLRRSWPNFFILCELPRRQTVVVCFSVLFLLLEWLLSRESLVWPCWYLTYCCWEELIPFSSALCAKVNATDEPGIRTFRAGNNYAIRTYYRLLSFCSWLNLHNFLGKIVQQNLVLSTLLN